MLINFYGANRLKLNDKKTSILVMKSQYNKITFSRTNDGQEVTNSAQIKVLGIYLNGNGNLHNQIRSAASKRLYKIQPALEYMNPKERRLAVSSLVTSITNYCASMS